MDIVQTFEQIMDTYGNGMLEDAMVCASYSSINNQVILGNMSEYDIVDRHVTKPVCSGNGCGCWLVDSIVNKCNVGVKESFPIVVGEAYVAAWHAIVYMRSQLAESVTLVPDDIIKVMKTLDEHFMRSRSVFLSRLDHLSATGLSHSERARQLAKQIPDEFTWWACTHNTIFSIFADHIKDKVSFDGMYSMHYDEVKFHALRACSSPEMMTALKHMSVTRSHVMRSLMVIRCHRSDDCGPAISKLLEILRFWERTALRLVMFPPPSSLEGSGGGRGGAVYGPNAHEHLIKLVKDLDEILDSLKNDDAAKRIKILLYSIMVDQTYFKRPACETGYIETLEKLAPQRMKFYSQFEAALAQITNMFVPFIASNIVPNANTDANANADMVVEHI